MKINTNIDHRFATKENLKKIELAFEQFNIESMNGILTERELDNILHETYNEIFYDDIRNGLIIDAERAINMLAYYGDKKDIKKVNYLSWLLNKYYSNTLFEAMNKYVDLEYYEEAAIMRDALLVTVMPTERG